MTDPVLTTATAVILCVLLPLAALCGAVGLVFVWRGGRERDDE